MYQNQTKKNKYIMSGEGINKIYYPNGDSQMQRSKFDRYPKITQQLLDHVKSKEKPADVLMIGLGRLEESITLVAGALSVGAQCPRLTLVDYLPQDSFMVSSVDQTTYSMPSSVLTGAQIAPKAFANILKDGELPNSVSGSIQTAVADGIYDFNIANASDREKVRGNYDVVSMNNVLQYLPDDTDFRPIIEFLINSVNPDGLISCYTHTDDKAINGRVKKLFAQFDFFPVCDGVYQKNSSLQNHQQKIPEKNQVDLYDLNNNLIKIISNVRNYLNMVNKTVVETVEVQDLQDLERWLEQWNKQYFATILEELINETEIAISKISNNDQIQINIQSRYILSNDLGRSIILSKENQTDALRMLESWRIDNSPIIPEVYIENISTGTKKLISMNNDIMSLVKQCETYSSYLNASRAIV